MRSRDLTHALADILLTVSPDVQIGGTLADRQDRRDQILISPTRKEYRSRVNSEEQDFATGATGHFNAGWTFEITVSAFGLADETPADRMLDLLDATERALMLADSVRVGSRLLPIQIVSADLTPRPDGADAEMAVITIRLTGPQAWAKA